MATGTINQPANYSLFSETSYVLYSEQSISAHAAINGVVTFSRSGYYPLAISGWSAGGASSGNVIPGRMYLSARDEGSATVTYNFQNGSDTALSGQSFSVRILWIKV